MDYVSSKNICLLIRDTLKLIDRRPMDHGSRTGYLMIKMLMEKGGYEQFELADFLMVASVHDIGAYKTDDVGDKLQYEFKNYLPHSIYGFLFLKNLSPLAEKSRMILYHRLGYSKFQNIDFEYKFETSVLCLAEAVDIYHYAMGQTFDYKIFRKQEGTVYSKEALDLLDKAVETDPKIFEHLRDDSYQKELDEILGYMIFPNEEKKRYMEMLMYCIGFRSEQCVVDSITTLSIVEELCELMHMSDSDKEMLYYGSLLHDLGMLSVPKDIVEAPRKLTDDELALMRGHVEKTEKILNNRFDRAVIEIAIAHHERMDGSGYYRNLKEEEMNLAQCVLQVADVMTGLTAKRTFRDPFPKEKVIDILNADATTGKLKKEVVDVLVENYDAIKERTDTEAAKIVDMYEDLQKKYEAVNASLSGRR